LPGSMKGLLKGLVFEVFTKFFKFHLPTPDDIYPTSRQNLCQRTTRIFLSLHCPLFHSPALPPRARLEEIRGNWVSSHRNSEFIFLCR
jgi:hypothetical protein